MRVFIIERECVMFLVCPRYPEAVITVERLRESLFRANFGSSRQKDSRKISEIPSRNRKFYSDRETLCENVRDPCN